MTNLALLLILLGLLGSSRANGLSEPMSWNRTVELVMRQVNWLDAGFMTKFPYGMPRDIHQLMPVIAREDVSGWSMIDSAIRHVPSSGSNYDILDFVKIYAENPRLFRNNLNNLKAAYIYMKLLWFLISPRGFHDRLVSLYIRYTKSFNNHSCSLIPFATETIPGKYYSLFPGDYTCKCEPGFVWQSSTRKCLPLKGCGFDDFSRKGPCGFVTQYESCRIENSYYHPFHRTFEAHFAEINCKCRPGFMGVSCNEPRNACIENYHPSRPNGNVACGTKIGSAGSTYGRCVPHLGSNEYKCECNKNRMDDPSNDFPDCYKAFDVCINLQCQNGYCKKSSDLQNAICVCHPGFYGKRCNHAFNQWLQWEIWSPCEPSCGFNRIRTRTRKCPNSKIDFYLNKTGHIYESHGYFLRNKTFNVENYECYQLGMMSHRETQSCYMVPCSEEGKWTGWSQWSDCKVVCGLGVVKRHRKCQHTGFLNHAHETYELLNIRLPCIGLEKEMRTCWAPKNCTIHTRFWPYAVYLSAGLFTTSSILLTVLGVRLIRIVVRSVLELYKPRYSHIWSLMLKYKLMGSNETRLQLDQARGESILGLRGGGGHK